MSEPVLVYKKGEGWVYEEYETYTVKNRVGETIRLINRRPQPGERFMARYDFESCKIDAFKYDFGAYSSFVPTRHKYAYTCVVERGH